MLTNFYYRLHIHGKEITRSKRKRKHGSENSSKSVQSRVLAKEHMSNSKNVPKRQKIDPKKPIHEKKFACKFCDKSYTQAHSLKTHIKTVHEGKKAGKRFKCRYPLCTEAFTQSHSLKNHIQKQHKETDKVEPSTSTNVDLKQTGEVEDFESVMNKSGLFNPEKRNFFDESDSDD